MGLRRREETLACGIFIGNTPNFPSRCLFINSKVGERIYFSLSVARPLQLRCLTQPRC